jgi:TonB-linked SusC/RagA family outer membrane protein
MKKNISDALRVRNKRILKFLIMSKCILLLVIISSLQSFSKGYSQDKISIKLHNVSLTTALKEIGKKSDYRFLYSDAVINGFSNKVNLDATDASINQIVSQVLANSDLSFKVVNQMVLITKPVAIAVPIKGKVTDSKGQPMAGVTVFEKSNPTNATVTDGDGNYSISVADRSSVVVIRYVGFLSQEFPVGTQTSINATLEEENATLNEVVVVGYGTQKRASVTGAISSVKGAELVQAPVPNISNSILGRVSGVTGRQSNGGQPGSAGNTTFSIRGQNTTGNNGPLIIVDNVRRDNINQIDPNAIETVSVLKDAAATAPYGLGGANGVILITTKQGKTGAPTISLNAWYGIQNPTYLPNVLTAEDYMRLVNEGVTNANPNAALIHPLDKINNWDANSKIDPDKFPRNNPADIIKKNAPQQSYSLQLSGGSDRVKYYTNLGFFNQQGMFPQIDYTRYNYTVNLEAKVTNTTTFSLGINGSNEVDRGLDPQHNAGNLLRSTYKYIPTDVYKFSNGLWGASNGLSPFATLRSGGYTRGYYNQQLLSASIEQKLPLKGLSIKGVVSYDPTSWNRKQYHKPFYYYSINGGTVGAYTYAKAPSTSEGLVAYTYLQEFFNKDQRFNYQGYLNYHNNFGKHDITGLVVAEFRNTRSNDFNARINNYSIDVDELSFGSSNRNDYIIAGTSSTTSQIGYVYRISDTYDNKYTVEATGRYDAHFAFAPGKRYAYFPAFSAGWIISNEDFMKNVGWVNYFKLKGSWGRTGNLAGGNFQYVDSYNLAAAYAFNGTVVQGTTPNNQANPNITWEVAEKTDIGFEAVFFKGLLNLDLGVFKQKRSNMLFTPSNTVSQEYGVGLSQINVGKMENYGIEITAGTQHKFANGLQLSLNGNFTYANNKTIEIFEQLSTYNNPNRRRTGRQLNSQFGYKSLGLFHLSDDKNGDGLINATDGYTVAQFGTLKPGNIKYADLSGPNGVPDGKIDINDETFIGYNPQPLITYGATLGANWKGFDATFFFQGAAKSSIGTQGFLTVPFSNNSSSTGYEFFNNRWTPANDMNAKYPRTASSPFSNDTQISDFWIRDASYLRLRTATLGYTVPSSVIKALKIKAVRFYVTGQNLLTFSKLDFIDPELSGNTGVSPGSDTGTPILRSWTFGLNATF